MVCGSRFLTDDYHYFVSVSCWIGIYFFVAFLLRIVDGRVSDPTLGFRLYNRWAIELFVWDYFHDYFEVEAVLMLYYYRFWMFEVFVIMYVRGGGVSFISNGKSAYYMVKIILALLV